LYALTLLPEPVGEQSLGGLHVDARDQTADLEVRIAGSDARVGIRIGEPLGVVERLLIGIELGIGLVCRVENALEFLGGTWIGGHAGLDAGAVDVA
jgi:hypothetical protein